MGFLFCDLHVSLNNPSSGDINSSNLPCSECDRNFGLGKKGVGYFTRPGVSGVT